MKNKIARELKSEGVILFVMNIAFIIFIVGTCMNFRVIEENKGMPVKTEEGYSFITDRHFSFHNDSEVRHPYLADRINLPGTIISFGDIFIYFSGGIFLFIVARNVSKLYGIYKKKRRKHR